MSNNSLCSKDGFFQQPKAFYMIFILEMAERFTFAGITSIIALFLIHSLNFNEHNSAITVGSFSAFIFAFTVVGGHLGDNVLGIKRSVLIGLVILLVAFCILASAHNNYIYTMIGLAVYVTGVSIFKPNPSSLLALFYNRQKSLDHIYTYYYMAINIGALLGFLLLPLIVISYGYVTAFLIMAASILLGILCYLFFYPTIKQHDNMIGKMPLGNTNIIKTIGYIAVPIIITVILLQHTLGAKIFLYTFSGASLLYFIRLIKKSDPLHRRKMEVALILMLQFILFYILYIQNYSSMTFFGLHNCNLDLWGIHFNEQQFNIFDNLGVILFSPILAIFYKKTDKQFSFITKFALGNLLMGISFIVLFISTYFADSNAHVSILWVMLVLVIFAVGELLISAVGLSMIATLIEPKYQSFTYGFWFIIGAIGSEIGGQVAGHFSVSPTITDPHQTLIIFAQLFRNLGVAVTAIGFISLLFVPKLKSMLRS